MDLDCADTGDPGASVVVTTSRGDTVRLTDYGCGYLNLENPLGGPPWWLSIDLQQLE
jgi:hypothetical protein